MLFCVVGEEGDCGLSSCHCANVSLALKPPAIIAYGMLPIKFMEVGYIVSWYCW